MSDEDFFPEDEEEERESKGFRIVKRCFKWLLFGASALVWGLVLYTVITTRESKLFSKMYFSEDTRKLAETQSVTVKELHTNVFMNYDGSISIGSVWYCEDTDELEIGIKINKKLLKYQKDGNELTGTPAFTLTDGDGNEYVLISSDTDTIGRYTYYRVRFRNVTLDLSESSYTEKKEKEQGKTRENPVLTFELTLSETKEPLATYFDNERKVTVNDALFIIFDGETQYKTAEYDD